MEIRIDEDKWGADIRLTPAEQMLESQQAEMPRYAHLEARIRGTTEEDAHDGAQFILDLFAKGRTAYIRVRPETVTDKNFDSKAVSYYAWVRFSFQLEAGEWHDVDKSYETGIKIPSFGSALHG